MPGLYEFTQAEKRYLEDINKKREAELSPYAAKHSEAVRLIDREPNFAVIRPAFSYDTDYILHSIFYNRYADKTQVFSFYKNDDLTRRALHVQFVSKIARTIGRALKLNLDLIEAISLGHDIGHTPFGHKGEEYLSECYEAHCEADGRGKRYFRHNVHSARVFRYLIGSNLTLQTLSGILSHNGEKAYREYAPVPLTDFAAFDEILEHCYTDGDFHKSLRPNTLEGCVVRVSDMIAYAGKDRQDLYRAKLTTEGEFSENLLAGVKNSEIISALVVNIIKNSINSPALNMDEQAFADLKEILGENRRIIYDNKELNAPYEQLIRPLMHGLYDRLLDDVKGQNTASPVFRHHLDKPLFRACYYRGEELVADPNEVVCDFIASMTDDYFIDICKHLHIDDALTQKISYREYF